MDLVVSCVAPNSCVWMSEWFIDFLARRQHCVRTVQHSTVRTALACSRGSGDDHDCSTAQAIGLVSFCVKRNPFPGPGTDDVPEPIVGKTLRGVGQQQVRRLVVYRIEPGGRIAVAVALADRFNQSIGTGQHRPVVDDLLRLSSPSQ